MIFAKNQNDWEAFLERAQQLTDRGRKRGKVHCYADWFIRGARGEFCRGVPGSLWLLSRELIIHRCATGAMLAAMTLKHAGYEARVLQLEIDGMRLKPLTARNPDEPRYHFVVETMEHGRPVIYDTSMGMVFDRKLYWKIEHPTVHAVVDGPKVQELTKEFGDFQAPATREEACAALAPIIDTIGGSYGAHDDTQAQHWFAGPLLEEVGWWTRVTYFYANYAVA